MKPVRRRALANQDARSAARYYAEVAGLQLARRFVAELDAALPHIGRQPGSGSPRYSKPDAPESLRFWTLDRFPYCVFYVEGTDRVDVLRVLHQSSDIPRHLNP